MKEMHVMNAHGFIFTVDPRVKLKTDDLVECRTFDSEDGAQAAQAEMWDIPVEDAAIPWRIEPSDKPGVSAQVVCDRGSLNDIDGSVEEYISNENG